MIYEVKFDVKGDALQRIMDVWISESQDRGRDGIPPTQTPLHLGPAQIEAAIPKVVGETAVLLRTTS